jgi:hypothetical protein
MASSIVKKMLKHKMGGVKPPSEEMLSSSKYGSGEILKFRPGMKKREVAGGKIHSNLPTDVIGGPTTKRPGLVQRNRFGRRRKSVKP